MPSLSTGQNRNLRDLALDTEYRTGERDLIQAFYQPCLSASSRYDRAVGYFRSTVFAVVGHAAARFALEGGRMRFVCSPSLAEEDIAALEAGYEGRQALLEQRLAEEIDAILADPSLTKPAELLATLISSGGLDLRIALRPARSRHLSRKTRNIR